jgi:hypothetical protein
LTDARGKFTYAVLLNSHPLSWFCNAGNNVQWVPLLGPPAKKPKSKT